MLQTKLVTRADISQYRQLSQTLYDSVLDPLIVETQILDIKPLLGEFLFNAIMRNPYNYEDILNGGSYEYLDEQYENYGLKAVISFYVYARYKMYGNEIDTPFSTIEKLERSESRPVTDKSKKDKYQINRDAGFDIWRSLELYLIRTSNELFCKSFAFYNKDQRNNNMTISKIE
jgi:hypothetical protein